MSERSFTLRLASGDELTLSDSRRGQLVLAVSAAGNEPLHLCPSPADLRRLVDAARLFLEGD